MVGKKVKRLKLTHIYGKVRATIYCIIMSTELLEELEVLSSIYNDCIVSEDIENGEYIVKYIHKSPELVGSFYIPAGYPSSGSPVFSVSIASNQLSSRIKQSMENSVQQCIVDSAGDVVLFSCISAIVDLVGACDTVTIFKDDDEADASSADWAKKPTVQKPLWYLTKSTTLPNASGDFAITTDVYHADASLGVDAVFRAPASALFNVMHGSVSETLKSTFQSHIAVVHSMEEVHLFREIVLSDKKTARATHNIFAYRFSSAAGLLYHDTDDDGMAESLFVLCVLI